MHQNKYSNKCDIDLYCVERVEFIVFVFNCFNGVGYILFDKSLLNVLFNKSSELYFFNLTGVFIILSNSSSIINNLAIIPTGSEELVNGSKEFMFFNKTNRYFLNYFLLYLNK